MSQQLIVNNKTYNYPSAGENPGWGEDATGWASSVTTVLNSLQGLGDILATSFAVPNNSSGNVEGLFFDGSSVQSAVIEYHVYRRSDTNTSEIVENGEIRLIYDNDAVAGRKWKLAQKTDGDSGMAFDISDAGQITYISTDIGAAGYTGVMKFKASTL